MRHMPLPRALTRALPRALPDALGATEHANTSPFGKSTCSVVYRFHVNEDNRVAHDQREQCLAEQGIVSKSPHPAHITLFKVLFDKKQYKRHGKILGDVDFLKLPEINEFIESLLAIIKSFFADKKVMLCDPWRLGAMADEDNYTIIGGYFAKLFLFDASINELIESLVRAMRRFGGHGSMNETETHLVIRTIATPLYCVDPKNPYHLTMGGKISDPTAMIADILARTRQIRERVPWADNLVDSNQIKISWPKAKAI
jgi:hypothetical protein